MELKGVYTALITPFNKDESVDYDGYRKNIQFQIESGVDGILPLGTTGETPTLTGEEQEEIIKLAVEEAKGKVNIMVGTGTNSTKKTVEATRKAKELGADIALVVTPYYNKPTNEGLYLHFKAASEVGIPICVYNIKGRTGKNIDTPTMKRIAELPNIIGVKEASGDLEQMKEVIEQIQKAKDNFNVMSGDDGMTIALMENGGKGIVSVVSNLVPKQLVEMVTHAAKGNFKDAKEVETKLQPIFKGAFIETNPIPIKAAMCMAGMAASGYRLPMCELMPESREKLKKILLDMGILS